MQPRGARAGLGDVGNYLADAARQIFTPAKGNQVPWSGTGIGFSGSITHHDQARLREYYSKLRQARMSITGADHPLPGKLSGVAIFSPLHHTAVVSRQDLLWTGCLDPNASNYNPEAREEDGSCVYIGPSGEQYGKGPDMKKYVNTMLERIVGGDSTAGLDRKLIEEGEIISQDDLDNLVGLCAYVRFFAC